MLYAVICNDKKDHLHIRLEIRPKHIEYLKSLGNMKIRPWRWSVNNPEEA